MAYLGHFCLVSKNKSLTFYSKNAIILEPSDGKSGGFNLLKTTELCEYSFRYRAHKLYPIKLCAR